MMQFQTVTYNFDKGVDTKSDVKIVQAPYLVRASNAIVRKRGSLSKRHGNVNLPQAIMGSTASIDSGVALATFQDELLLFNDARMYAYGASLGSWVDRGAALSLKCARQPIVTNTHEQSAPDSARNGNIAIFAWEDSRGGVRASVKDLVTGTYFLSDVSVSNAGSHPRCFSIGGYLFVSYFESESIRIRRISTVYPTAFSGEQTPASDVDTSGLYDIVDYNAHGALIAYASNSGSIQVGYVTIDGFMGNSFNGFSPLASIPEAATGGLTLVYGGSPAAVCVAWGLSGTGPRCAFLNPDLTIAHAAVTIEATATAIASITALFESDTSLRVFWTHSAGASYDYHVRHATVSSDGSVGATAQLLRSVGLASKPWRQNSQTYVAVAHDSLLQATYFVVNADGGVVGKALGTVGGGIPDTGMVPSVVRQNDTVVYFAALEKSQLRVEGSTVYTLTGVTAIQLDYNNETRFSSAVLGQNLHIVGGIIQAYDGARLFESGYHLFPENITAAPSSSGGAIATGDYAYRVVYEWTDNRGQLHRSAPSAALAVTATGPTASVVLTIPTLRLTARPNVSIVVYRTVGDGSIYYQVSSVTSPLYNDTSVDSVSYTDTVADSDIHGNAILYTDGGELENDAPPGSFSILAAKNRLFLVDDRQQVWFSKEQLPGSAVEFSLALAKRIDPLGGAITGLAVMDEKIIICKAGRILAFSGDGPTPAGEQDSFTDAQVISADVGADNQNSFVLYDAGLMFKNAKGVFLLSRGMQVDPVVGIPVYDYRARNFTSANLIQDENEIRFTTEDGDALVYNFVMDVWTTFTGHEAQDAVIWNGSFCHLKSSGIVAKEDSTLYTDNGNTYALEVETAWLKWAAMQGFQRVSRLAILGTYLSPHTLMVQLAYDYQDAWVDTLQFNTDAGLSPSTYGDDATYGSGSPYGGDSDTIYQLRASLPRQKLQALRVRIYDNANLGAAYDLTSIDFVVGSLGGLMRLRAAKSI